MQLYLHSSPAARINVLFDIQRPNTFKLILFLLPDYLDEQLKIIFLERTLYKLH
jgi:hypothetical protein